MSDLKTRKAKNNVTDELSAIPNKIYFTIGEVAELCKLKPHVLRYWEQEFTQLAPNKRRGNRRYYQHKDVLLVRKIRHLLHEEGYTIEGARQQLNTNQAKDNRKESMYNALRVAVGDLEKLLEALQ